MTTPETQSASAKRGLLPAVSAERLRTIDDAGPAPEDADQHPHKGDKRPAVRLSKADLKELSQINVPKTLWSVVSTWLVIVATIVVAEWAQHWAVTVLAVLIIGGRQHGMTILAHDASHFRFLPGRRLNDWVADLFVAWPAFMSAKIFRFPHGPHHRFLGEASDGNRDTWHTHDLHGDLVPAWQFPKSVPGLTWHILKHALLVTGVLWILRRFAASLVLKRPALEIAAEVLFFGGAAVILTLGGWWREFAIYWLLPFCTWQTVVQYARLICEHSGHISDHPSYRLTRSTHPGLLGRALVLPFNIGHHLEHHWYPSVPWYNLPALHQRLRQDPTFAEHANVQSSVWRSLGQCLRSHPAYQNHAS